MAMARGHSAAGSASAGLASQGRVPPSEPMYPTGALFKPQVGLAAACVWVHASAGGGVGERRGATYNRPRSPERWPSG